MTLKPAVAALIAAVTLAVGVVVGRSSQQQPTLPPAVVEEVNQQQEELPVRAVSVDGERTYFNGDVPFSGRSAVVRFDVDRRQIVVWVQVPPK